KNFYGRLFGWQSHDSPMGPDDVYTIFRLDGRDAAAAYTLRADQKEQGVPPNWVLYVSVDNADASAARVPGLGGTILAGPFDVGDSGRMAVAGDPTGAVFCIWQA